MRILILAVFLAAGLSAQTPGPSNLFGESFAAPSTPVKSAAPAKLRFANPQLRFFQPAAQKQRPFVFLRVHDQKLQELGVPQANQGKSPNWFVAAGGQIQAASPCSIPLLNVMPEGADKMDPKMVLPGSTGDVNAYPMPMVQVPAPSCADIKK